LKLYDFAKAISIGFLILSANAPTGFAQGITALAQLNGQVRDPSGSAVPKTEITLTNIDTNQRYTTVANAEGRYILTNVASGNYQLEAEFSRFAKYTQTGIILTVGQAATIEVTLSIAAASETVTVDATTPVIEPARTEVSQVVQSQQIQSLPINGRLFTDFALLSPGVATGRTGLQSTFTDPATTRISFAGQRDLNNSVTVDGADNINTATGSQRSTPSQEAVSEFRVVNNSFGAEYGRALGGIVNIVTKSGTNYLNGSVYDYLQNNATDAKSILTLPQFDTLRQNQYGGTLGGPIVKDQTFFFASYEGQRRAESPTYPAVLFDNLGAINAVKQSLGLSPENLNVLKTADYDKGLIKVDHQLNDNNRLSLRYSIEDSTNLNMLVGNTLDGGGIGAPSSGRNGFLRDQSLVGSWTSVLSPTLVNSMLVQWARRNYGFPGVTGEPTLDIPNLLLFGNNFGAFNRYNESRVQFSDTVSWAKDNHNPRFGFDSNYIQNFVIWPGFTPSRDIFPSLGDFLASGKQDWDNNTACPAPLIGLTSPCIAAFFWGAPIGPGPFNPNQASPSIGTSWQNAYLPSEAQDFDVHLNHGYNGFFAQDQWRANSKLTFNYGLRYDFETGLGYLLNPYYKEFQPRLGLAFLPDSKTVVRAGYGVFDDKYNLIFLFVPSPQRPPVIPGLPTNNNQQDGTWLLNSLFLPTPCVLAGCPAAGAPGSVPLPSGTVPPPLVTQAFENLINSGSFPANTLYAQGGATVDRNLRPPYSEQVNLEIDRQIGANLAISAGYMLVEGHRLVRPIDLNVGPPIGKETGTGKDIYDYGLFDPNIPAPPGGSPGTNGIFYYTDSSGNSAYNGLILQVMRRTGKYLQFNANYTYSKTLDDGTFVTFVSTPQSNAQRNLERALSNQDVRDRFVGNAVLTAPKESFLKGFELSSVVVAQSPRPFTLFVGFDANNDGNPVTDRVGESARNTYFGDSLSSVDLRVSRAFRLSERLQLVLSVDAFNALNRANVDEVFSVYGAPDFIGPVPQHYKDGISGADSAFGSPRTTFNPRQFQFAAKLRF
jgi:outer membrane receptor protein involved in Fe transport